MLPYLFIARRLGLAPEGIEGELVVIVIAAATWRHLILSARRGSLAVAQLAQNGSRLKRIASQPLADQRAW
jgi:hypothetical protein